MFARRKPPQLPVLEELQQTYNDCCNLTIKNLTLEEQNEVEEALKGWKSLHTSLLFKIELFDKNVYKMSAEELSIFNELKAIRDQNVKHLIRVQLRMDELNRRQHVRPPILKVSSANNSNMTVPSLRSTGGMRSGLNHNSTQKKKMLKSLRPEKSVSSMNKASQQQASAAANVIWSKPKPALKQTEADLFQDFDQDLELSHWEKLTDDVVFSQSAVNLIDLEDDYFNANHSMENLTLKPNTSKSRQSSMSSVTSVSASPTNTMRANGNASTNSLKNTPASSSVKSNSAVGNSTNNNTLKVSNDTVLPPNLDARSASAPDIKQEKKYIYNKPKPMNINRLMKQTSYAKVVANKPTPAPKPKAAAPAKKVQTAKAPVNLQGKQVKKSNITYNYVPSKKPEKAVKAPMSPVSPTMDDIIGGYDIGELEPGSGEAEEGGDPVGLGLAPDLLNEKVQAELISSIRGIDPIAAKQILNDIIVHGDEVYWDDIVGLEGAKNSLKEAVVYPFLRPDLFQGLREPTRGMLLFGPPGTGKTMLARAVATESKSTFFSITSSSITSKYLGESEKLVKAMFLLAKKLSPSIVFIDEIDSLLSSRNEGEVESSRRIKNEFLVQWSELSSATTKESGTTGLKQQVLILGATNMPWSIDEAARRRFVKRVYIPLPEAETRMAQILRLLKYQKNTINESDYDELIQMTHDFSGSDITALCKDSAMGPLRSLGDKLLSTPTEAIRPINIEDFKSSLKYIRPSVAKESLSAYEDWSIKYGSSGV